MNMLDYPSPHFNERRDGAVPDMLILHYTNMTTPQEALTWWQKHESQVSAHYLVGEDGTMWRVVPEDKRAWHAGKSWWKGETDINSRSIGVEIANGGHANGLPEFPAVQMAAVAALCHDILSRHQIPSAHILGHSDIAPGRKIDPGEGFDWRFLAAQGIGLWPGEESTADGDPRSLLTRYGYNPDIDLTTVLTAFQRHFHPEIFGTPERIGQPEPETLRRLQSLLRQANL